MPASGDIVLGSLVSPYTGPYSYSAYNEAFCPDELCDTPRVGNVFSAIGHECTSDTWAEFGVGAGTTATHLLNLLPKTGNLFLFDGWEGLPDEWELGDGYRMPPGSYHFTKPKFSDPRVSMIDGWFKDSLPFRFGKQLGVVHFDCDIYQSTKEALFGISEWIGRGTMLIFDEILGYQNYREHEYRALCEWRKKTGNVIRWLAKDNFGAAGVVE